MRDGAGGAGDVHERVLVAGGATKSCAHSEMRRAGCRCRTKLGVGKAGRGGAELDRSGEAKERVDGDRRGTFAVAPGKEKMHHLRRRGEGEVRRRSRFDHKLKRLKLGSDVRIDGVANYDAEKVGADGGRSAAEHAGKVIEGKPGRKTRAEPTRDNRIP